jgi:hypothetical protein
MIKMNLNRQGKKKIFPGRYLLFLWIISLLFHFSYCRGGGKSGISTPRDYLSMYQGEKRVIPFSINNQEDQDLERTDQYFISYHLYDLDRKLLLFDNRRFDLPVERIKKKQRLNVNIPIFFNYKPGRYLVEFDLVREGKFWGGKIGWETDFVKLDLKNLFTPEFKKKYLSSYISTPFQSINQEQYILRLVLKNSEIYLDGKLWGFSAGSGYPQVWIRDLATMIKYGLLYYPLEDLQQMLEMFLNHQKGNGEIVDWVDLNGGTDKNTVETDQESSLIIAASELAAKDPEWLNKTIGGITVKKRLLNALGWVWNHKRDPGANLIYSGFTADWGDVEKSYPDQRAIKLSDRSRMVFSIYTQAMFIRGIKAILPFLNISERRTWEPRLNKLRDQARKILFLEGRGYFIVHIDPEDQTYLKLEKGILPLGGNAEAIRAGLMTRQEIARFIRIFDRRRKTYNLRTVSFTLVPPYPRGFFPHPALSSEWSYQNGGEWDWIGGRYISALFMNGFKNEAHRYLLEIIKKHLRSYTIFEWEDRQGNGRGSFSYGGAAGVIGEAIMLGYSNTDEAHQKGERKTGN